MDASEGPRTSLLTRPRLLTTLNSTIPNHVDSTVEFFTHLNGRRLGMEPKTDPDAGFTDLKETKTPESNEKATGTILRPPPISPSLPCSR